MSLIEVNRVGPRYNESVARLGKMEGQKNVWKMCIRREEERSYSGTKRDEHKVAAVRTFSPEDEGLLCASCSQ